MRPKIFFFIASIFALFLSSCGKIDYSQHEKELLIYQKPLIEVEKLAEDGDSDAKLRLAINKVSNSPKEALEEMKNLYVKSGNLTAGYYIANRFSSPDEKKELLRQISQKGNSYYSVIARCDLLIDDLKDSLSAGDKRAFYSAYGELLNYAKKDFQPAAIKLAFFIDTHAESLKGFKNISEENMFLYKKLSEISKGSNNNYKVRYAQELAKSGKWKLALSELMPLVSDFMARKNFSMEESLMRSSNNKLYAEAKATAITACAYENGLGVRKDTKKAKEYRDKIAQIKNPWWYRHFADTFEESYGRKGSFIFSSPIDAKTYRNLSTESENNKTERLRQYNLSIAQKVEKAQKKSLEELKNATDEIGKVEYAKKLLGVKTLDAGRYTIGKYNNANAKEAIGLLEKMAKEGNQYANLSLAQLYWEGNSKNTTFERVNMPVNFDGEKARAYALEAIRIGGENAMAYVGRRFLDENTPEGDKKAFEMFSKMDEYGYGLCSSELGGMYFSGRGTKQDYKKAFEIFSSHTRIYNSINTTNCAWLALMYKMGLGVEKSEEMSNKYIALIEESNSPSYNLALLGNQLVYGDGCLYDFKIAPKCPELGVEMIRRAVSMKEPNSYALRSYAIILEEGKYAKQDLKQAAEFYEKFARLEKQKYYGNQDFWGFSEAIRILKNSPDKADSSKAFSLAEEWLKLSPDSINAKVDMALLFMNGIGVEKDEKRAVEYLNEAIKSKSKLESEGYLWRAYGVLAYCYMKGIGVEKSLEKVRKIISTVRKIKTSRCGIWHPFLTYAEWFNPNTEITDTCVIDNPTLPKSKEICLFWLDELEKVADTAKNPRFSVKAYQKLINFFVEEKGFENPNKVDELKIKLQKAKARAEAAKKNGGKRK